MITKYGVAPAWDECEEAPVPDFTLTKLSQGVVGVAAVGMHPVIGKKASAVAVARQLNMHYANDMPVRVHVKDYGWFLLGNNGWSLTKGVTK